MNVVKLNVHVPFNTLNIVVSEHKIRFEVLGLENANLPFNHMLIEMKII
jgi:hypothetical protein